MKLTSVDGTPIDIDVDSIIEFHNRGKYREVKTGVVFPNGSGSIIRATSLLRVTESVPEIMKKVREEKTK